jgi:DHA1 family inner membrane transport protein
MKRVTDRFVQKHPERQQDERHCRSSHDHPRHLRPAGPTQYLQQTLSERRGIGSVSVRSSAVTTETRRRSGLGPGWVLFMALFAAQASILVLSPILPQIATDFGVSTAAAAQLRSVSAVTAGVVALVLAVTGNRFRLSWLLYGGLTLLAISSAASAIAPAFWVLVATHVLMGFGLAAVLSGGMAASETWAAAGESRQVLSRALIGQPVAWVIGQPVAGLVAGADWRWAWIAVPFFAAVAGLLAMLMRDRKISDAGQDCDPLGLWRQPGVKPWAISELLAFTAWGGALVYAGAVFIEEYGVTVGTTGLVLGVGAAFYLPGNWLGRRTLEKGSGLLLVGFSIAAGSMIILYSTGFSPLWVAVVGFAAAVFFDGGRTIAGAALGLLLSEGRRLAAMSVRTGAGQFGYLLGAGIGGALLGIWGYPGMAWGFGVLFVIAGLIHLPRAVSGRDHLGQARRYLRRRPAPNP